MKMEIYPYGENFQKKLIKYVLVKNKSDVFTHIDETLFDSLELRAVYNYVRNFFNKQSKMPSYSSIVNNAGGIFDKEDKDLQTELKKNVVDCVKEISKKRFKVDYDEIEHDLVKFIRAQEQKKLLFKMNRQFALGNYEHIVEHRNTLNRLINMSRKEETLTCKRTFEDDITKSLIKISSGFEALDRLTLGIQPERMWTIIGKKKLGKSYFALTIAYNVLKQSFPVTYISSELTVRDLNRRLISMASGVNYIREKLDNSLKRNQIRCCKKVIEKLDSLPFKAYYSSSLNDICSIIEASKSKLYIVENLQDIRTSEYQNSEARQLGYIAKRLLQCAKEHKTCVIGISQISPTGKMARSSGEIDEACDIILTLEQVDGNDDRKIIDAHVINRNFVEGEVTFMFDLNTLRIREHQAGDGKSISLSGYISQRKAG